MNKLLLRFCPAVPTIQGILEEKAYLNFYLLGLKGSAFKKPVKVFSEIDIFTLKDSTKLSARA